MDSRKSNGTLFEYRIEGRGEGKRKDNKKMIIKDSWKLQGVAHKKNVEWAKEYNG